MTGIVTDENDCPDCQRLNAINERIKKVMLLVPAPAADGVKQLKEDATWMSEQLRSFQKWAARVVALDDHVRALTAAVRVNPTPQIVVDRAERVRRDYEALFNDGTGPKDAA